MAFVFSFKDVFDADTFDRTGYQWSDLMTPVGVLTLGRVRCWHAHVSGHDHLPP